MNQEPLTFKVATEDWEFELIHRLNYKTFVEEIPQHQASPTQRLVDKFNAENTYLVCLQARKLVGMLAVRGTRPFSLDHKLPNLDSYLPQGRTICEIRLLAIEKKFRGARGGQVLQGILALLWQHGVEKSYDLAIISGTPRQFRLYQHLGFVPFGPVVGSGDAQFQPMYVTLETFEVTAREFLRSSPARSFHPNAVNFLPGPVTVRREVRRAFEQAPESHRGDSFKKDFHATKQTLCELTKAKSVEIFMGSGTLANDIVAMQLSLLGGRGLILSSGEFGERLVDHARRLDLDFDTLKFGWGETIELSAVEEKLRGRKKSAYSWLWCAHCETSTGLMSELDALKNLCAETQTRLCLDCISTIGTMPVDLTGVYLASCASGKGLRSYPGLSMIFYNHSTAAEGARKLPRYFDLDFYARQEGIPFTFSSNLLHALRAAVKRVNWEKRFAETAEMSTWLRGRLVEQGFHLVGNGASVSPAVITIQLPPEISSVKFGGAMQETGYLLSFNSEYLRGKNWVQICLMGEYAREKVVSLANAIHRVYRKAEGRQQPTTAASEARQ
ncbi:MAG TPA: aminotransferase class V-fold PLP-dependent enzyme [Candidatus Acidoferrum sp.]|jgi:aspartate aminotransferase-like enzyme|nr:aminotransferase class V-fold PLP-dependent enzyme [Candidatus Acidoferrum sp.]